MIDLNACTDEYTKIAVNLAQLRKATRGKHLSKLVRRGVTLNPWSGRLDVTKKGLPSAVHSNPEFTPYAQKGLRGRAYIRGDSATTIGKELDVSSRDYIKHLGTDEAKRWLSADHIKGLLKAHKANAGASKKIRSLKGKDREAFNRAIHLHEKRELAVKPKDVAPFSSHMSLEPPLQDLNIAATLEKQPEAAKAIRAMRASETKALREAHPSSFGRLRLGKERLSRHAIKRLNQLYKKKGQG